MNNFVNTFFKVVISSISTWAHFWMTPYPWIRCEMKSLSFPNFVPFPALCGRSDILEQRGSQHPHNQLPHRGGGPARWVRRRIYSGVVENKRFFANNPNEVFFANNPQQKQNQTIFQDLSVTIPWTELLTESCHFTISGLTITLQVMSWYHL